MRGVGVGAVMTQCACGAVLLLLLRVPPCLGPEIGCMERTSTWTVCIWRPVVVKSWPLTVISTVTYPGSRVGDAHSRYLEGRGGRGEGRDEGCESGVKGGEGEEE